MADFKLVDIAAEERGATDRAFRLFDGKKTEWVAKSLVEKKRRRDLYDAGVAGQGKGVHLMTRFAILLTVLAIIAASVEPDRIVITGDAIERILPPAPLPALPAFSGAACTTGAIIAPTSSATFCTTASPAGAVLATTGTSGAPMWVAMPVK